MPVRRQATRHVTVREMVTAQTAIWIAKCFWAFGLAPDGALSKRIEAAIAEVTVFNTEARVVRVASVRLDGPQEFLLPLLPAQVDPQSIRLAITKGSVERVEIRPVATSDFPRGEAQLLIDELKSVDQKLALIADRLQSLRRFDVNDLSPKVPDAQGGGVQQANKVGIDPHGWPRVFAALDDWNRSQDLLRAELNQAQRGLADERARLTERATALGTYGTSGGHEVRAWVSGTGVAELRLSYMANGARWRPTYEIQYDPSRGKANVFFAGIVQQTTGEDWNDAKLILSTAIPSRLMPYPRLPAWRIGSKERFVPTPQRTETPIAPPPSAVALPRFVAADDLRKNLAALAAHASSQAQVTETFDADFLNNLPLESRSSVKDVLSNSVARAPVGGAPARVRGARSAIEFAELEGLEMRTGGSGAESASGLTQLSLGPPVPLYQPPPLPIDSPARLAGGYALTYESAGTESVRTGKDERRIALFSRVWPVKVTRKVLPAVADEAFLVAEMTNPSPQPLPGGQAQLFVGADPAGTAQLKLVSPNESFTLPLGLDPAIKPVRNVVLSNEEQGVFSKDEITTYTVTIELTNPYAQSIAMIVQDQIPVNRDRSVEIKRLTTQPSAAFNDVSGALTWAFDMKPSSTMRLSFKYSLKRPKGYLLRQ